MVIVNQDKTGIYNFDNIKSIDVVENEVNITDDILSNKGMVIGTYETEKRAKEVLQEIVGKYKQYNLDDNKSVTTLPKIYTMPEK